MREMTLIRNLPALTFSDSSGEHCFALEGELASIGRSSDQDLVLPDSFVSRRHALIRRVEGGFEVVDQGSSHGTYRNGVRIDRAPLHSGDTLQFGSLSAAKFVFEDDLGESGSSGSSLADNLVSALTVFMPAIKPDRSAGHEIERLSFLINAARQLNAGGAIKDILQLLLQLTIKLTGVERGFVFLRENGEMRLALGMRVDGTLVQEDSTLSRRAMNKAIESESNFSVSDTLSDGDAGAWASVMANSIRCIYCIPLRKHASAAEPGQLLGLLYLDSQLTAGHLSEIDHQLLDTIATEAATLLDNALLAESERTARQAAEELAVAARIHASLMSIALPTLSYANVQARTVPCLAIGGDFYDAVALDDCLGVVIADVSGKGVPASIVAATLQGIIHAQMLTGQSLAEIASLVNRFLCTRSVDKYATMILLKLYPDGRVEYVNCGHVKPLFVSNAAVCRIEDANLIVGLLAGATYVAGECRLVPGDRILLATDGITEADYGSDEQFGDSRFLSAARHERIDEILERVVEFQAGTPAQDDCTLLDIRYTGE
jgi:phosphoserine phosphatase RsbU/P